MNRSLPQECIHAFDQRSATILLTLLVSGDLAFVILHFINALTPLLMNPLLSLERDNGYSETFQYLKFLWIVILLILYALRRASWHYVLWAAVFAYLLVDDSLRIHERVGLFIAQDLSLSPALRLRPQDHGELFVSVVAGIVLFAPLAWAYRTGTTMFRKISIDLALLIGLLVFFGVVVDMAHIAIGFGGAVNFLMGVIEEGGEMLSVSIMVWYAYLIVIRDGASDYYLCDCIRLFMARRSGITSNPAGCAPHARRD